MRCVKGVGDLLNRQENLENFSYPYVDNRFHFVLNLLLNIRNVSVMSHLLLLTQLFYVSSSVSVILPPQFVSSVLNESPRPTCPPFF